MAKRRKTTVPRAGAGGTQTSSAARRAASRAASQPAASPFSRRLFTPVVLVGVLVIAVVGVVVVGLFGSGGPRYACGDLLQPQPGATVENPFVTPDLGAGHVATDSRIEYASCPPASGRHYNQARVAPLPPQFYGPDARVGPGNWLHNLEHGFAVALYRCVDGTCPTDDELNEIRQFVLNGPSTPAAVACGYPSKVLAARFDDMATPFALLAWNRALLLEEFDAGTAIDFAERWIEATALEPNSC
jgi:hypothetical protein